MYYFVFSLARKAMLSDESNRNQKKKKKRGKRFRPAAGWWSARTIFAVHWSFLSLPHHVSSRIQRGCVQSFVCFVFPSFSNHEIVCIIIFLGGGMGGGRDGERRKKKRVAVLIEVSVVLQWLLSTSRAAYYSSALSIQCSGWPSLSNLFLFFIFYFFVILCWPLATYEL